MNRSDPIRPGALLQLRFAAKLLTAIGIGLALVLIFLPPLVNGHVEVPICGQEKSPPLMAV